MGKGKPKKKLTAAEVLKSLNLPTSGDVYFEPDKNWYPSQPLAKGPQNGYMDRYGQEWTKGPSRTPDEGWEWDVQLFKGGHLNIDWNGKITHPKPPSGPKKGGG